MEIPLFEALGAGNVTNGTNITSSGGGHGHMDADDIHGHSGHHEQPYVILFLFASFALGALVRTLLKIVPGDLPYTVVLLVLGILLGLLSSRFPSFAHYTAIVHMNPHMIFHVFLPVLIFESAFAMDTHMFWKSIYQILIMALPGLLLASFLTGILSMYTFDYGWNWYVGMMFGSICSATDPVAVVALLKELGASKQLGTLIEGESLLNDGCGIVIFTMFLNLAVGVQWAAEDFIIFIIKVMIGGPAFGFFMSKLTSFWLANIFNDALTEITITLASTYITFYVAEVLGVSGVLAVVILGLTMERTSISPEVESFLHRFWEMMAYLANTVIFILVGIMIMEKSIHMIEGNDWFYIITLYFGINVIRLLVIIILSPATSRVGYGLSWRYGVVTAWSGLRGAVGLAMALLVMQQELKKGSIEDWKMKVANKILIHVAGIVFLTLFINATTIKALLKLLGMSDISAPKRMTMYSAVRRVKDAQNRSFQMLKGDRFLADAEWNLVEKACEIQDPYKTKDEEVNAEEFVPFQRMSQCHDCKSMVPNEPSPREYQDMAEEARLRTLKAQKVSYWKQFEHGMLNREAVRVLVQATESAADSVGEFVDIEEIKKHWKIKGLLPKLRNKLEELVTDKQKDKLPMPEHKVLRTVFIIVVHPAFEWSINVLIILNLIPIIIEFAIEESHPQFLEYQFYLRITNYVFFVIYILEAIFKIVALRKHYFFSHWNQFDLFIIAVSIIDIVLDNIFGNVDFNPAIFRIAKIFRLLRAMRMLRLSKAAIPRMINIIDNQINKKLSFGYDVGKGFVVGEEEVMKLIPTIIDNKAIARDLRQKSDISRRAVIRELGLLQRDHPGIAVSVKTRQSMRAVLNHSRDTIREMQGGGLLDETEAKKLEMVVEIKMKQLARAPPSIPPPNPEQLLRHISWLEGNAELTDFMKARAQLLFHDFGSTLCKQGDRPTGLYLIVSGMVKLRGAGVKYTDYETQHSMDDDLDVYEDYLTSGNIIGEIGILHRQPRSTSVSCETSVQTYYISADDMEMAFDLFSSSFLKERIWRVVAIRISTPLLLKTLAYQGWTHDKVRLRLETGYMPTNLADRRSFEIDHTMDDVILVQGQAVSPHTREEFDAPCIIPRTIHKLTFNMEDEVLPAQLLVVPNKEVIIEDDTKRRNSLFGLTASRESSLCLQHAAQRRSSHNLLAKKSSSGIFKRKSGKSVSIALPSLETAPDGTTRRRTDLQPISDAEELPL
ncbi:SLC9C1 [Branchiostoma lanceolatum]|uniref:Solute carrier family 9 member C1 n=1 Tax=Branchiostoma lanceolatum TaxID=7740 RepID=A0A8J9ZQD3_BRALA|nr:SLC9C1 [Branchiostoma lanceolatum]